MAEGTVNEERSLRAGTADEGDSDKEERADGFISKLANLFKKKINVAKWADADKSDDFVMKKLKLTGLSGEALTQHTNYKFYEQFVTLKRVNAWQKADASTYAVWRELGLGHINTWDDLVNAADTDAFKLYLQYAEAFDKKAITKSVLEFKPLPILGTDTSWSERVARIVSWRATGKLEEYVVLALGFDRFSPAELLANKNGKAFEIFWLLKNDKSLHVNPQSTKDMLKKFEDLDKLSPQEMTILKSKDSLEKPQRRSKFIFRKVLGMRDVPEAEIPKSEKFETYKYMYDLIKNDKSEGY
ncbi:RxLR effector protein [Phytophthora megakarya]|uniref:RxLR effector protein n=1 Tax=Phytophthora megakarya TaxID=4795 RepID=A0A225VAH2_9STRA|nr:RxLR effector protein [Phytophthora megakarya]